MIPWSGKSVIQSTVVDITLRKVYEERLHYQANFDSVTDLPNRTLALDRLSGAVARARRHARKVGILFVDLDHFKKINDTMGHALGDKLLRQAAHRIKSCVREDDTVARLGGDEFTVILPDIGTSKDAESVSRKILDVFGRPFSLDNSEAFVSASVGISLCPDDGNDAETLMRNADAAMYQAKEQGRNTVRFFTPKLNERALERIRLEAKLRGALDRKQFILHYQPLVDMRSDQIIGAEALLRWPDSKNRPVSTERVIRLAEDTGLIVPLGEWVLHTACKQIKLWRAEGLGDLRVSVNVSSRQFRERSLVDAVTLALKRNRLSPDCLELEITEGLLMDDLPETKNAIGTLESDGVRLAVDDFGTGYSSLRYLTRFPLDTLKIDRSFIKDVLTDQAYATLVEAIIAMAHRLNLRVIAEGVETEKQLEFLRARGCDVAQGFYFSNALSPKEFGKLIRSRRQPDVKAG
jgi:diguanylate cyclase (GGDEF)-like protein